MFKKLLSVLTGAPVEQIAAYLTERRKLKHDLKLAKLRAKVAAERAKEERAKQADKNQHEWEILQIHNSGWKDEFVLIVISVPLIMSFVPGLAPYAAAGFANLEQTPLWYRVLVLTVFFAIYGIRKWQTRTSNGDNRHGQTSLH